VDQELNVHSGDMIAMTPPLRVRLVSGLQGRSLQCMFQSGGHVLVGFICLLQHLVLMTESYTYEVVFMCST
jgi:hypothetical protein